MNVVLTGFMGTGKTEVGKALAEKLGYEFLDTDELIEKRVGLKISEIFEKFGEPYFRKIESEVVEDVSKLNKKVISTGGGVVLKSENMENLSKNSIIINLRASPEEIYNRLKDKDDRPLLKKDDVLGEIKKLLEVRKKFYERCDYYIDTDGLTTQEVVEKVFGYLTLCSKNKAATDEHRN